MGADLPQRSLPAVKLSSPATEEFWEIPVLYEDEHLFVLAKPACLLTSPDRYDPKRPNLMRLVLEGVERQTPWAAARHLTYLSNAHRLDFETTGILVLAKDRSTLISLANQFSTAKPVKTYVALASGTPDEAEFSVDVKLAPDERQLGVMRWAKTGKPSLTHFKVLEKFAGSTLLECKPVTGRTHQIRVHLKSVGHPIYADSVYGGRQLFLSRIKPDYRLKPGREERPLTPTLALHAWRIDLLHPVTGAKVEVEAPWPKDLNVALKYLRQYAAVS
jgi:RluA family pseudouridine synthase